MKVQSVVLLCVPTLLLLPACGRDSGPHPESAFDPLTPRVPSPTRALKVSENWSAPLPQRTKRVPHPARVTSTKAFGVPTPRLAVLPSDAALQALPGVPEPLTPVPGSSTWDETRALAEALSRYQDVGGGDDTGPLEAFVQAYPRSRWNPSLLLNLGLVAYKTGYFGKALRFWDESWNLASKGLDAASEQIANRALAEYAKMNARVGRREELDRIFSLASSRTFTGAARVALENAIEGRWVMEHKPGVAFRCGPYALLNVARILQPERPDQSQAFLDEVKSPPEGFSLDEVWAQSKRLGLKLQRAYREPGAAVIVPSVVHWKVEHFGALIRQVDGRYLLDDPTFGNQTWLSRRALDEEASGFFLVPDGALPPGWRRATEDESLRIFGKGHSGNGEPDDTGDDDPHESSDCDGGPNLAMGRYRLNLMLASLSITDTPVGYASAVGPDVYVKVTYNQREAGQPSNLPFTNFSPSWVSSWVSYIEDNPSAPTGNVVLRKRNGGGETFKGFDPLSSTFAVEPKTGAVLERLDSNTYVKRYPNGRREYYEQFIGTLGPLRRVFLSRVVDPQGNEVVLTYDASYPSRIASIVDATGLATIFTYSITSEPYLVTAIADPYGRTATFAYTDVAGILRLQSMQDVYGIVTSFTYDAAGGVTSMSTPYGSTLFSLSPLNFGTANGMIRYVEATDPYGSKERVEYNVSPLQTGIPNTLNEPRPDLAKITTTMADMDDRNSFYWDKLQMEVAAGDYSKAHVYHWIQPGNADVATAILESERPPLEGRIWYNYSGQPLPFMMGTLARPSAVGRVVYDETGTAQTQAAHYEYTATGLLTRVIDPVGRETVLEYAPNGIDLLRVRQKVGAGWETRAEYTYDPADPPHRPRTMTDGGGQLTQYAYNALGQVQTITDARGDVTTFVYETQPAAPGFRRLIGVTGAVKGGDVAFTYDGFDRVRTVSKVDGITLTYDYDDLDRVTAVTYPDGSFEQKVYADHSLVAARDRSARWTRYAYNALRQRVVTRDPAGRVVQQQWCRCGQLRRLVDGNGNITEWDRDEQGRVAAKRYADGTELQYTYDFAGRLATFTNARGQVKTYRYFIDDRLKALEYEDPGTPDVAYTYDPDYGRISTRTDGTGLTTYAYVPNDGQSLGAGHLDYMNGPLADDTRRYAYDALGRISSVQVVDDATRTTATYSETYGYDARGRVTGTTNNLGAFAYVYAGQSSRMDHVDYPNGMRVAYNYYGENEERLLQQISNLASDGSTISRFAYAYNQDRTIRTWEIEQGGQTNTWALEYDPALQLTDAVRRDQTSIVLDEEHYGYDDAGNRVHVASGLSNGSIRNYRANKLNQLVAERGFGRTVFAGSIDEAAAVTLNGVPARVVSTNGGPPFMFRGYVDLVEGVNDVTVAATDGSGNSSTAHYQVTATSTTSRYEYDLDGNLRFERDAGGAVVREYQWDQESRLVRIIGPTRDVVMEYDASSRRARSREFTGGIETGSTTFLWCGARVCQDRDASGAVVLRSFVWGGLAAGPATAFYTWDHLRSVREVVGNDGVSIESRYAYDLWGAPTRVGGSGMETEHYFGGYRHAMNGLQLAWFRGYDAQLGRWISRDPLGEWDGPNIYAYVGNVPLAYRDPYGLNKLFNNTTDQTIIYIAEGLSEWGKLKELGPGETAEVDGFFDWGGTHKGFEGAGDGDYFKLTDPVDGTITLGADGKLKFNFNSELGRKWNEDPWIGEPGGWKDAKWVKKNHLPARPGKVEPPEGKSDVKPSEGKGAGCD